MNLVSLGRCARLAQEQEDETGDTGMLLPPACAGSGLENATCTTGHCGGIGRQSSGVLFGPRERCPDANRARSKAKSSRTVVLR